MGREVFTCLELEKPLAIHFCEDVSRYVITCTLLRFVECNLSNGKKGFFCLYRGPTQKRDRTVITVTCCVVQNENTGEVFNY